MRALYYQNSLSCKNMGQETGCSRLSLGMGGKNTRMLTARRKCLRIVRQSFSAPRSRKNVAFFLPMQKRCSKNLWQPDQNRLVGRRPVWSFTAQHQRGFKPCCQKQPVKNVSTISGEDEIQNVTGPVKGRLCVFGCFEKKSVSLSYL